MTCSGDSSGLIIVALREENNNFHIDAIERVPIYSVISVFLNWYRVSTKKSLFCDKFVDTLYCGVQ